MIRLISFSLLFIFLFSCGNDLETIEIKHEGKIIESYTRRATDFAKQGIYTSFSPDGNKLEVSNYDNNQLHGKQTFFYSNGQPQEIVHYKNGQHHGEYKTYFENGILQQEGTYVDGAMNGELTVYYPSGKVKEVLQIQNNIELGPFKEYHKNGNLKTEGAYGGADPDTGFPLEDGELKKYDEAGELIQKMDCKMGRCTTTWQKDSTIVQ